MEIFLIILIAFLIFFFFIAPKIGNIGFWKLAAKHPEESWKFFNEHPDWFIGSPPTSGCCGPYRVLNPYTQSFVNVYCTNLEIAEKNQREFIDRYK